MKKKVFNLSSKYNLMIAVIAGGAVAVLAIGLLLIRPAWSELQELGQDIPTQQQSRDLKQQDYKNLQSAEKFFRDNPQTVEQVNTAVPISPEVPSILVMLESLAKQNGVFLTSFSPQQLGGQATTGASGSAAASSASAPAQGANPAGVNSVEITANFSGPYPSLLNFLYNLERSLRIVDVKTLTVTSSTNGLEGNLTIKAYYVQVPGGPNPIAATGTAAASPAPSSSQSSQSGSSSSSGGSK